MEILKNSVIFRKLGSFSQKFAEKWQESNIGWLITRNFDDIKTKNSLLCRFVSLIFNNIKNAKIGNKLSESVLLNIFSHYEYGVYAMVFLLPFMPTMLCAALGAVTVLSFFLNALIKKEVKLSFNALSFTAVLLLALFFISCIASYTFAPSIRIFVLYFVFILAMFPVIHCAGDKKRLKIILALFIISGLLVSLYGIYQQFYGTNEGHAWIDEDMFSDIKMRVYSTFDNPNVLGEFLLMLIPACGAVIYGSKRWYTKAFAFAVLCCAGLCLIFTQSRGCWLGIILAAAIFAFLVDKRLVIIGLAGLMFLPSVLPQSIINRFASIGDMGDSSTSYRVHIWLGTLRMLKNFWWNGIGVGTDAFNRVYPIFSYNAVTALHSHNLYLQLITETGITGIIAFLMTMVTSFKKVLVGYLADKKSLQGIVCVAVIAGTFGFLLQGMFDYAWYNFRVFAIFWLYIGMGIGAANCICSERDITNVNKTD